MRSRSLFLRLITTHLVVAITAIAILGVAVDRVFEHRALDDLKQFLDLSAHGLAGRGLYARYCRAFFPPPCMATSKKKDLPAAKLASLGRPLLDPNRVPLRADGSVAYSV